MQIRFQIENGCNCQNKSFPKKLQKQKFQWRRRLVDESHRLESDLSLILAITIVVLSGDVGLEMVPATVEHCLTSPSTLHCTAENSTISTSDHWYWVLSRYTRIFVGTCTIVDTRGQTLFQNNCQLIGMSLIGLARQAKKITINRK